VLLQQGVRRVCSACTPAHKEFAQRFIDWRGKTRTSKPPGFVPVLYRLPEVRAAVADGQRVWLVEGEKDVHTAEALGEVATTNPDGGGIFLDAMADELVGAQVQVVLDLDETGWARAVRLHSQLTDRGPELSSLWAAPVVVVVFGAAQRWLGARTTVAVAALGHIVVSLVVAMTLERDGGPRPLADEADVVGGSAPLCAFAVVGRTGTDVGHLLAWGLGLGAGAGRASALRATVARW